MAGLTEARIGVAADLDAAGLNVVDHIPAKVTPPMVIIGTGDPYVVQGDTFSATEFVVRLELFCIAGTAVNSAATKALDGMISKVIFHLGDWDIEGVSAPYMAAANDAQFLTSRITVTNTIEIQE